MNLDEIYNKSVLYNSIKDIYENKNLKELLEIHSYTQKLIYHLEMILFKERIMNYET